MLCILYKAYRKYRSYKIKPYSKISLARGKPYKKDVSFLGNTYKQDITTWEQTCQKGFLKLGANFTEKISYARANLTETVSYAGIKPYRKVPLYHTRNYITAKISHAGEKPYRKLISAMRKICWEQTLRKGFSCRHKFSRKEFSFQGKHHGVVVCGCVMRWRGISHTREEEIFLMQRTNFSEKIFSCLEVLQSIFSYFFG